MFKKPKFLLIPVALFFFALNFIDININEDSRAATVPEKFDSSLTRLNSLNKLEAYTDSMASEKKIISGSLEYALLANEIVSQRFYHKYATHSLKENWVAAISEKITGLSLATNFTADDILKKPYGYCVQSNTVLMKLLQKKGCDYKIADLPHHFTFFSRIKDKWCFFDADMDPAITAQNRSNEKWLHNIDSLSAAYKKNKKEIETSFGSPVNFKLSSVNLTPASHARAFQQFSFMLSKVAFLFPLLWFVYLSRKRKKQIATKNIQQATQYNDYHIYGNERFGSRA